MSQLTLISVRGHRSNHRRLTAGPWFWVGKKVPEQKGSNPKTFRCQRFWASRRSRTNCRSRTRVPAITHCPRPVTWLGATLHGEKGREGGAVSVLLHHVHHVSSTMADSFVIIRSPTSSSSSGQGFSTFSRIKRGEEQ